MLLLASRPARRRHRGFTLIELMITAAVIAVLAGIAYPSYMSSVRKGRRADAVQALTQLQQAQERWRAACISYNGYPTQAWPTSPFDCGTGGAGGTGKGLGQSSPSAGGYYTIAITSGTVSGTGYTATATAVTTGSQANDTGCTTLTVVVSNGAATNTPTACWSK